MSLWENLLKAHQSGGRVSPIPGVGANHHFQESWL